MAIALCPQIRHNTQTRDGSVSKKCVVAVCPEVFFLPLSCSRLISPTENSFGSTFVVCDERRVHAGRGEQCSGCSCSYYCVYETGSMQLQTWSSWCKTHTDRSTHSLKLLSFLGVLLALFPSNRSSGSLKREREKDLIIIRCCKRRHSVTWWAKNSH